MRERLEDGRHRKTWEKMMEPAYEFHPELIKAAKCAASTYRADVSDPPVRRGDGHVLVITRVYDPINVAPQSVAELLDFMP